MPDNTFLERVARGIVKLSPSPIQHAPGVSAEMLIVVIDCSGSMDFECGPVTRLEAAKDATLALLDARRELHANDQVAVIMFDDSADLVLPFMFARHARSTIDSAVRSIRIRGGTDLRAPLNLARKIMPSSGIVHIVMLTDGYGGDPVRTATSLKGRGAIIETIGVGFVPSDVDETMLKKTASVVDGKVLYRFLQDADAMADYFRTEVCNRLVKLG